MHRQQVPLASPAAKGICTFDMGENSKNHSWPLGLLVLTFAAKLSAQSLNLETNTLVVNSFALNPYVRVWDGQWLGITVASDDNCYFGSSTHDNRHGAGFFRYNPTTAALTLLAEDLTQICGENPTNRPPQGKLHSDIVEANGWLYFSTHLGNYWDEALTNYTGGHVLGYELATGHFRDFGVVRSNYTCYSAVGVDKVRNKLLVYVTRWWGSDPDSHLYRIDIPTGAKQDLGVVPGFSSFWFFVDTRGDCWFSCPSDNGSLRVARSATGLIQRFNNVLPEPQLGNGRWWDWAKALPGGSTCVFKLQFGNYLYTFNSDIFQTNAANAFTTVRNIGPADSGLALASNRVFYIQRANRQPGNQEFKDFHLMSVPLFTNTPIIDHGLITDQSGRLVWRIPGMATDEHGRVFMVGDWWLLPGEQGTEVGTLRHVDDPGTNYVALPRGEFFGVADLSQSSSLNAHHFLKVTTAGGGFMSFDANTNLFLGNAVVTLSATASNGWQFLGWSGNTDGTNTTKSIVMTADKSIQAVFGANIHTAVSANGAIVLDPPGGLYPYGTPVRLTAIAQAGNYFLQWGNAVSGNLNPLLYRVTSGNATISAVFDSLPFGKVTLSTVISGQGNVSISPRTNLYDAGQNVALEALPEAGQLFTGWSGDASGTNRILIVTLTQSKTIMAGFSSKPMLAIQRFSSFSSSPELTFDGEFGGSYRIDATTNLVNWQSIGPFSNVFGTLKFIDPASEDLAQRFYRAVQTGGATSALISSRSDK